MDLNATLFFKTKFDIAVKVAGDDLLKILVQKIRCWMLGKYGPRSRGYAPKGILSARPDQWTRFQNGGRIFSKDRAKTLFCESEHFRPASTPEEEYWACQLVEYQTTRPGYAPRKWITEIGFESVVPGKATLSLVLSYTDVPGFIGPCEDAPSPSVPKIIRFLIEDPKLVCSIDGQPARLEPVKLESGGFERFQRLLMAPERKVPIVYISPFCRKGASDPVKLLLSPQALAGQIATNALVYYAQHPDADTEMRYYVDPSYQCCGGRVRIYMSRPDPSNPSDAAKHRYLTPEQLNEWGEEQVLGVLRRVLAREVDFYETMFRLEDCRQKKDEERDQRRLEALRARSEQTIQQTEEEKKATIEELDAVVQLAERERDLAKKELQDLQREKYSLETRLGYCQADAARVPDLERALDSVRMMAEYPVGPKAVCAYFEAVFADRLAFSEEGHKSLDECTTRDDILWEALYHMATTLHELYADGGIPQIDKEFQNRTGWELSRGEGSMTRKDSSLMKQYVTTYEGREINTEAHVKCGRVESDPKFLRIYFGFDTVSKKLIIDQCGKHKENRTTQKVH